MPFHVNEMIARNRLQHGDVVMTRSGANFGDTAVYLGEPPGLYACADCLIIRPRGIPSGYLATYLNSTIGRALVTRGAYGCAQSHIAPSYLKTLRIPRCGQLEQEVHQLVQKASRARFESSRCYRQAQRHIVGELGLSRIRVTEQLSFRQYSSHTGEASRLDAEHYQPKYYDLAEVIRRTGEAMLLAYLVSHCHRGVQPVYARDGPVAIVNTKHLGPQFLDTDLSRTTQDH